MYSTSFGVNIGLGLLLESILEPKDRIDDSRQIPNKVDIKKYDIWYLDLKSFIVNVVSAYDSEDTDKIISLDDDMLNTVVDKVISEYLLLDTMVDMNIVIYHLEYRKYKSLKLFKEKKEGSKAYKLEIAYNKLLMMLLTNEELNILKGDNKLPKKKCLITTSNPLDLLNVHSMEMDLLEYHTGVLKSKNRFYTKLNNNSVLPYQELILLAIGDKKGIIKPKLTGKEKKEYVEFLLSRKVKPYNKYSNSYLMDALENDSIKNKLKEIKLIY